MNKPFRAVLLSASMLVAAPAFAQITIIPMPPAPQPTASGPPLEGPGLPVTPFTASDVTFVQTQLEGNLAEIKAAQLALQQSQNQNVRNFAQKMITDHTAANGTLMAIASRHEIAAPSTVSPEHQAMLDSLSKLSGTAFDVTYINDMVSGHEAIINQMNDQLIHGESQYLNVWVQNTRPVVLQHEAIAQQIKANLPRTG